MIVNRFLISRPTVLDLFVMAVSFKFYICQAYRLQFIGKEIQRVWFISGFYADNWWKVNDTNCTVQELETALEGIIITDIVNLRTDNVRTISGMVSIRIL